MHELTCSASVGGKLEYCIGGGGQSEAWEGRTHST